jgi:2'-hydroxyisoflavone reductase
VDRIVAVGITREHSRGNVQLQSCAKVVAAMSLDLLVLGGSGFVGRALIDEGLARGWSVTTFNRGGHAPADPRVRSLIGDRLRPQTLSAVGARDWDVVADTWEGPPRAARDAAEVLRERAARYVYVSSCSVYAPPPPLGVSEAAATVAASPDAGGGEYAERKRGSELAITAAFGERALLARAGLILGPHENVGRLPWWLNRIAAGGRVLAPGPPELALQYIDARDLAVFALDAATAAVGGPVNVVSQPGHATMRTLLETCREVVGAESAELVWTSPETILAAGIEPWMELPIWIPPGHAFSGMHAADVERAHSAGLSCRPLRATVADTWAWLRSLDGPPPLRPDVPAPGLDAERERALLERQSSGPVHRDSSRRAFRFVTVEGGRGVVSGGWVAMGSYGTHSDQALVVDHDTPRSNAAPPRAMSGPLARAVMRTRA